MFVSRILPGHRHSSSLSDQPSLSLADVTEIVGGMKGKDHVTARCDFPDGRWDILQINFRLVGRPIYTRVATGLPGEKAVEKMSALLAGDELATRLPQKKRTRLSMTLPQAQALLAAGESFPPLTAHAMGTKNPASSLGSLAFLRNTARKAKRAKRKDRGTSVETLKK